MAKESIYGIGKEPVFRETFNDQQTVEDNGGTVTDVSFSEGVGNFNGVSSGIKYPKLINSSVFSVRFVFEILNFLNIGYVVSTYGTTTNGFVVLLFNDVLRFYANAGGDFAFNTFPDIGKYEVICTYDGTFSIVYINSVAGDPETNNPPDHSLLTIGYRIDNRFWLDSNIELVEVYDYVLTQEEVSNLYQNSRYREVNATPVLHLTAEGGVIEDKAGNSITNTDVEVVRDGQSWVQKYNGSSSGLDIPFINLNNKDFSFEIWFKAYEFNDGYLFDNRDAISDGIAVFLRVTVNLFRASFNTVNLESNTVLNKGLWYHAVFTFNNTGNAILYIDGVEDNSIDVSTVTIDTSNAIKIGRNILAAIEYYRGNISTIRIYEEILTAKEVSGLYNSTKFKYKG